jgi:hypothetical protein
VFKALESHSCASAPYDAQPRLQRTESHNLSYLINVFHLYSALSTQLPDSAKLVFNGIARIYALGSWNPVSKSVP